MAAFFVELLPNVGVGHCYVSRTPGVRLHASGEVLQIGSHYLLLPGQMVPESMHVVAGESGSGSADDADCIHLRFAVTGSYLIRLRKRLFCSHMHTNSAVAGITSASSQRKFDPTEAGYDPKVLFRFLVVGEKKR